MKWIEEIEDRFLKEEVEPVFNKYQDEVLLKLLENEEVLKTQVFNALKSIAEKAKKIIDYNNPLEYEEMGTTQEKEKYREYKVRYIDFSLLQIGMLDESYEVTVIGYDENWYGSEGIWEVFSVGYIFERLKDIKDELYQKIKKYVGKIRHCRIEQYILKQIPIYNNYFIYFLIKWLKQWDEDSTFKEIPKLNKLQVIWGEYKNDSKIVYKYDNTIKSEDMFKEKLKNGKQEEIIFTMWPSLKVNKFTINDKDITCMNLKEAELENIFFSSCKAVGLNLKKAHLKRCYFKNCDLGMSDFTECVLEKVIFEDCILRNINLDDTQFKEVYRIEGNKLIDVFNGNDMF
ncbi:hypothetical protein UT300005_16910 [Clostridium sp. CTA-5]